MRFFTFCLAGVLLSLAAGCDSPTVQTKVTPQDHTTAIAKQLREVMTEASIMKLDAGRTADTGLRGLRQREKASPYMHQLIKSGTAAKEPLWQLINDDDESVRRSIVILLGRCRVDEKGKPIDSKILIELTIPLLEHALASKDPEVRSYACSGLGDYAIWSDETLERLNLSVPKLLELRKDSDKDVRSIGWAASNTILGELSRRAKIPEDRKSAAKAWEQFKKEKWKLDP